MRVRVSTISPEGLKVQDTLPLEPLNARMNEGRSNDIVFLMAPLVDLTVYRTGGAAEVKGTVKTRLRQPCSLCLEEVERELEIKIDLVFAPRPADAPEGGEQYQDDVGTYYYEGDHIELEEHLQEILILPLSPFWHPPVDEKGRCQQCGKETRRETEIAASPTVNLGSLLAKAREKQKRK